MKKALKQLGFSENLSTIYTTIFEYGELRAGQVIEHTGLQRSVVYKALNELEDRGLVSKIQKGGVAAFQAADPERLVDEIEEKKKIAKELAEEMQRSKTELPREIIVSEGEEAIKRATARNLTVGNGETVYVLGASIGVLRKSFVKFIREDYHPKRERAGMPFKIMYDHTVPKEVLDHRNALPTAEAKYLPTRQKMPIEFNICGDRMFIAVTDRDTPIVFSIRSQEVADAMKNYFNYMWDINTQIYKGHEGIIGLCEKVLEENPETLYLIGAKGEITSTHAEYFPKFNKKRTEQKIKLNILSHEKARSASISSMGYSDVKYLPAEFENPLVTWIFGDYIALVLWEETQTGFLIHSKSAAKYYRKYFQALEKLAKP